MLELLCLSAALLSRPAGLARPPSVALPALPPQAAARALFAAPPPLLRREPRRQFTASAQLRRARSSELRMSEEAAKPPQFKLYPQRWVQLAYLALLAFLSDWVCFAVAAAPDTWEATFAHDPAVRAAQQGSKSRVARPVPLRAMSWERLRLFLSIAPSD